MDLLQITHTARLRQYPQAVSQSLLHTDNKFEKKKSNEALATNVI